jgi:hypothetical protein
MIMIEELVDHPVQEAVVQPLVDASMKSNRELTEKGKPPYLRPGSGFLPVRAQSSTVLVPVQAVQIVQYSDSHGTGSTGTETVPKH